MDTTNSIIIGGGQAGLALSRCLADRDHDHLVLERGRVAERWHSERWNSMHLLTPNWMTRLPGYAYTGSDPDGFMAASEVAHFFTRYATSFSAPILDHTAVEHVAHDDHGFLVATDRGQFRARNIVVATGWCDRPAIPAAARQLSARIHQVVPSEYRAPEDLPAGGVLVVGAVIGAADQHMRRVLERIDGAVERLGLTSEVLAPEAIAVAEPGDAPQSIHLAHEAITSVVWATGHTRRYEWLDLPILDELGEIRQRRGVTAVAGAYVLGQRFQHYRNSNFIDGVGRDAEFVADHICTRAISLGSHPSIRSRQN